jgi:hypothetical protein
VSGTFYTSLSPAAHNQSESSLSNHSSASDRRKMLIVRGCIALALALLIGWVLNSNGTDPYTVKYYFESLFSVPTFEQANVSGFRINHGPVSFWVNPSTKPIQLKADRSFQTIDALSGGLTKDPGIMVLGKYEPWMTHCFYQPADCFLTDPNGDVWVYTDDKLSRAFVIGYSSGKCHHLLWSALKWAKIFKLSGKYLTHAEQYDRGNRLYYEFMSPGEPAVLEDGCCFKEIDPRSYFLEFPPRLKESMRRSMIWGDIKTGTGKSWITKYYLGHLSAPSAADIYVYANENLTHVFVIVESKAKIPEADNAR